MKLKPLTLRRHEAKHLAEHGSVVVIRAMRPQPTSWHGQLEVEADGEEGHANVEAISPGMASRRTIPCPLGRIGDKMWCKEGFARRDDFDWKAELEKTLHYIHYQATYSGDLYDEWHSYKWRPASTMPRCLSRFTVEVTNIECKFQDVWCWFVEMKRVVDGL